MIEQSQSARKPDLIKSDIGLVHAESEQKPMDFLEPLSHEEELLALLEERNRFLERNKRAVINILEDIQESERELRIQREELRKFKLAVDSSFNHIVITDADGVILYANRAAESLTGFSFEEMSGKTPALWGKQMSTDFYETFWHIIKQEKKPYTGEITNRRKNGDQYLANVSITPILDTKGGVSFFVGIERDITAERSHQEDIERHARELEAANIQIRAEKERAEGILRFLESIGEAVYATDANRKIIFINKTAANYIEKPQSSVIGTHTSEHFTFEVGNDDKSDRQLPIRMVLETHKTFVFPNHMFVVKSGVRLPVTGTAAPIFNEQKAFIGVIVIFQDITEKYALEQMKDRFLSVAAHQLRTPIGSMRWSMELLQSGDFGELPSGAQEAIRELYDNSTRLLALINSLLDVSRIDQGKVNEESSLVDMTKVIQEVVTILSGEAKQRGITLTFTTPEKSLPLVRITRGHMFEAIENLVSNALRYSREQGKVTVTLCVKEHMLEIRVSDTGIGIPQADQVKIFSKFFRASNAVRSFTDGSGLGLSVVKSYVEENGGRVSFESQENVGTTFLIELPVPKES
ncbi:MAG: PAS domain-containing protein [Candidatus Moranbacteria bacterium]|nr:PAS domain-containing protein [Candidatus Moranbacteria bacterium]